MVESEKNILTSIESWIGQTEEREKQYSNHQTTTTDSS